MHYLKYKTNINESFIKKGLDGHYTDKTSAYKVYYDGTIEYYGDKPDLFKQIVERNILSRVDVGHLRGLRVEYSIVDDRGVDIAELTWNQLVSELEKYRGSLKPVCINLGNDIRPVRVDFRLRTCRYHNDEDGFHAICPVFKTQWDNLEENGVTVNDFLTQFEALYPDEYDVDALIITGFCQISSVSSVVETNDCILIMNAWCDRIPVFYKEKRGSIL